MRTSTRQMTKKRASSIVLSDPCPVDPVDSGPEAD